MAASSARPDALARFADQLVSAADAVRPTLGQLRDALARVDATCIDHCPDLPPVVEMTTSVIGRDHELAAFTRQVGIAFASADAGSAVHAPAGLGGGDDSVGGAGPTTTPSDGGTSLGMPALRLVLSLPDVDRIVRDGNPVEAWHEKGVGYVIDWAAIVSDSAMLACQAVHHPYVCVGGPALRGATSLLRWWTSDTRLPGTDVRPHESEASVVSSVHQDVEALTDIVDDGKDVVETTLGAGERMAASAEHAGKGALHRSEKAVAHLAEEGSKLAHEGVRRAERLGRDLVPDLGFGFG